MKNVTLPNNTRADADTIRTYFGSPTLSGSFEKKRRRNNSWNCPTVNVRVIS